MNVITPLDDVLGFMVSAAPGASLTYAIAPSLPRRDESVFAVRRAYNRGLVDLVQRRNLDDRGRRDGFTYIAIRRSRKAAIEYPFLAEHLG